MQVSDFHHDGEEATLRILEKGGKRRTIGIHYSAAQAIEEYISSAGLTGGAHFRARQSSQTTKLSARPMSKVTLWRVVEHYLRRLPGSTHLVTRPSGLTRHECIYTPHSLRATTATLLLDAGVEIRKLQELLGHRHLTTTQIYDKRRRSHSESASHEVPI